MFLIWDSLAAWNEKKEKFEIVKIDWIELIWISPIDWLKDTFSINTDWKIIKFSISRNDPKKPEWIFINWKFVFAQNQGDWNITINGNLNLNLNKKITIDWIEFFEVKYQFSNEIYFTDWINVFKFLLNEKNEIQFFNYKWKDYPIINDRNKKCSWKMNELFYIDKENLWFKICYCWDWKPELIYILKNKSKEKNPNSENPDYVKINFSPEQEKLEIVFINPVNWIVCLRNKDNDNISKYWFYSVDKDWNLSLVFVNWWRISIKDEVVKVKEDEIFWRDYTLIRRNDSMSIFEPIILGNKKYLVAEWKSYKDVIYLTIDDENKIIPEELQINPDTFKPNKSFIFNWETFYFNNDWKVKIWNSYYQLIDRNHKKTSSPKDAICKIWNASVLLLKKWRGIWSDFWIFGLYSWVENNKEWLLQVNCISKNSLNDEAIRSAYINIITLDGKEYLCRNNYWDLSIYGIYELQDNSIYLRFINKVKTKKLPIWEEFMCDWKIINVKEILSDKYFKDTDDKIFFRPNKDKELFSVNLPEEVLFWDENLSFEDNHWIKHDLLTEDWKLVLLDNHKDCYILKNNLKCSISWKDIDLINVWDYKNNRVLSFEKLSNGHRIFNVWWYDISNAEHSKFLIYSKNSEPKILSSRENDLKVVKIWFQDDSNVWWYDISNVEHSKFLIYSKNSDKPKILSSRENDLKVVKIWFQDDSNYWIMCENENDTWWIKISPFKEWADIICAVYKIGSEFIAIDPVEYWYDISFKSWKISQELLDFLYDKLKPKWIVSKVIWNISGNLKTLLSS